MPKKTNKEKALIALLNHNSIRAAAQATGLSEDTFYRYLRDPEFLREYREAGRRSVETAINKIQSLTASAVDALDRNLNSENPSTEVRAASLIVAHAIKGVEFRDILERLERLEGYGNQKEIGTT